MPANALILLRFAKLSCNIFSSDIENSLDTKFKILPAVSLDLSSIKMSGLWQGKEMER